jgi:hypothetical protein
MNKKFSPLAASQLSVTYRPIGELIPDPRNARTHPKRQIEQLKASIKEFGFTNPILADPEGRIIAGHGRLQAAKALEIAQVPTITLSGLSETQKRALRIADNKIALNANWEILQQNSARLPRSTSILIRRSPASDRRDRRPPCEIADPTMRSSLRLRRHRTKPGDIGFWRAQDRMWRCTQHRILRRVIGEARSMPRFSIRRTMSDQGKRQSPGVGIVSSRWPGEMVRRIFALSPMRWRGRRLLRDGVIRTAWTGDIWTACWGRPDRVRRASEPLYLNKSNAGMGSLYRSKHELVFVYRVGPAPHLSMVELGKHGRNRTNVWDYASVSSIRGSRREDLNLHPTVKPVGLVADAIKDVTRHGDLVMDLFLGSGTTLLAAERTGRRFRGLEIDPGYVDVAIERWSARTGLEPHLEGQTS